MPENTDEATVGTVGTAQLAPSGLDRIITNLAADFVRLGHEGLDAAVPRALRLIGEFAEVDRGYVCLLDDNGTHPGKSYEWCADRNEASNNNGQGTVPGMGLPWFADRIIRLEDIYIPDLSLLPPEARVEKQYLQG